MWIKLTNDLGHPIRINMNMIAAYSLAEDGKHTAIEYNEVVFLVKQSVGEIDGIFQTPSHSLRLIPGW